MVKVSIIEDDKHFREGLEQLINNTSRFKVLHSYASAEAALPHLINNPPDIAIVDIKLPGKNGIDLIANIKSGLPDILCMVCSYYDDNEYIFNALKNGAVGYIIKDARPNEILESLEEISQGGAPMSRYIAKKVVSVFQQKTVHKLAELSDRENEILNLVATGLHIKEAADKLYISQLTVKCHLRNIYSKLHVTNKVEAINKLNNNNNFF
ncbi:MAG: response regulator transcription factor [Bacteroidetes bacterium]|nr:MAG: response regulator transcription factor [Bacteroidota bacterium]